MVSKWRFYVFEQGKVKTLGDKGETYFPHYIRSVMDRHAAWNLLYSLTQQLAREDETVIQIYQYGEMSEAEDETL